MELTGAEKKILSAFSFNSDAILEGDLDEKERSMLLEMRTVADYLHRKYPGYKFRITGCEPAEGTAREYNEWYYQALQDEATAITESQTQRTFIARSKEINASFQITDDFYGEVIRDDVTSKITDILSERSIPVLQVNASFCEFLDQEYGEGISVEDVFSGKINAGNDIKIFLDGSALKNPIHGSAASAVMKSAPETAVSKVEKALKSSGFIGDVYVVVLKSADSDPARGRIYSDSFTLD